jgi:phosphate uptake regulator
MKRKVVKQGPTTLMVSLPARWVRKYSIQRGDTIDVEEIERSIKITTGKEAETSPVELNTEGLDLKHIKRYLHAMYQSGYDEIRILYDDPKLVPQIQAFISAMLIGYEVVDQQVHSITVKSISKSIDDEFDQIFRRAFLVTKQLGENSLDAIRKGEYGLLKDIVVLEDTNDKLVNFCLRVLNKKGYKRFCKTTFIYCIVWQLEKIADCYRYICEYLMANPKEKLSKEVIEFYAEANRLFGSFYELFYDFSNAKLMKYSSSTEALLRAADELHENTKAQPEVIISHLHVMISDLYTMARPLIGSVV